MNPILNVKDVERILNHWLATPPNGYIGVRYGRNFKEILLKPMNEDTADTILQWMREDIPLFKSLSSDQLSIVSQEIDIDKKQYFVQVAGRIRVPIPTYSNGGK